MSTSDATGSHSDNRSPLEDLPLKPDLGPYGYIEKGKFKPCTLQELKLIVSENRIPQISLVWTPESPRLVPPACSNLLKESFLERVVAERILTAIVSGLWILISVANTLFQREPRQMLFWMLLGFANGLFLAYNIIWVRRIKHSEEFRREFFLPLALIKSKARKVWAVWILGAIIALVYILQAATGQLGPSSNIYVLPLVPFKGNLWDLISSPFLSDNFLHLIMENFILGFVGYFVERRTHWSYLVIVFLAASIMGNLLGYLSVETIVQGSTLGGFGLVGFAAVIISIRPTSKNEVLLAFLLGIFFVAMTAIELLDYGHLYSHLGGLICGALLGMVFLRGNKSLPLEPTGKIIILGHASLAALIFSLMAAVNTLVK